MIPFLVNSYILYIFFLLDSIDPDCIKMFSIKFVVNFQSKNHHPGPKTWFNSLHSKNISICLLKQILAVPWAGVSMISHFSFFVRIPTQIVITSLLYLLIHIQIIVPFFYWAALIPDSHDKEEPSFVYLQSFFNLWCFDLYLCFVLFVFIMLNQHSLNILLMKKVEDMASLLCSSWILFELSFRVSD